MPLKDCGTPLNKAGFQLNMGTWLQLVDCIYLQDTLNSQKQKLYNMFQLVNITSYEQLQVA